MNQVKAHKALLEAEPFMLEPKTIRNDDSEIVVHWTDAEIIAVRADWVGHYKKVHDDPAFTDAGITTEDIDRFHAEVMVCMAFCDLYRASMEVKPESETYINIKNPTMRCRLLIIHRLQIQCPFLLAPKNAAVFGLAVDREFRDYHEALWLDAAKS